MSKQNVDYKQGEILLITSGQYSDYEVKSIFRVIKDFNANNQLLAWAEETGREVVDFAAPADWENDNVDLIGWLSVNNFIADINYRELHTGDYGETELSDCG